MSKLSQDILKKIKRGQVALKPKWYFKLLRGFIWATVSFMAIFASLSSAIVIRQLVTTDWELARNISDSTFSTIIGLMPYLWILFIGVLIFAGDMLFKQTRKGYKYRTVSIIIGSILVSVVLGTGIFAADADQPFEDTIRRNFKPYEKWEIIKHRKFVAPNHGAIAGEVESVTKGGIRIKDFRGKIWDIDTKDTKFTKDRYPEKGQRVGIMGNKTDIKNFRAIRIKSWEQPREQRAFSEHRSQSR